MSDARVWIGAVIVHLPSAFFSVVVSPDSDLDRQFLDVVGRDRREQLVLLGAGVLGCFDATK